MGTFAGCPWIALAVHYGLKRIADAIATLKDKEA